MLKPFLLYKIFLAASITSFINASESSVSNKQLPSDSIIEIKFPLDSTAASYPLAQLAYSERLLYRINNSNGLPKEMVVSDTTKNVFDFLMGVVKTGNQQPSLDALTKNANEQFQKNPSINFEGLLDTARKLEFRQEVINALYSAALKGTKYIPTNEYLKQLDKESQIAIAGQLLHDRLQQEQRSIYTLQIDDTFRKYPVNEKLSNPSSFSGFMKIKYNHHLDYAYDHDYCDVLHKKMVSYRFEQREIAHLVIACALSPDGKYFAVIGRKHKPKDYVYAWLIELDNNGRGRTLFEQQIIPNKRLNINATDYSHIKSQKETLKDLYVKIQLVYDEYHNCFHIFIPAYMPSYEGTHVNPVFDLYTLNIASPSLTRKADLKAGNFDDHGKAEYEMRWSCIDGNLVGIYAKNPERSIDALIYTNGELLKCSLNNGIWEYTPSGNQTKEANFTIIGIPELNDFEYHDYRNNDRFAIEKNFIPSFTEIIQKNARALLTVKNPIRMRFDPRHLRLNYIYEHPAGKVNCVISSPCNPYLLEGCHILDKAKDTADILPTACFLYQYHTNSKSWHIQCKSIFDSVLPEIKKLYGITTAEQRVEIQPIPAPVSVIQPQPAKPAPAPTPSPVPTPQQTPAPQPKIAPAPAKPSPQGWRAWVGQMYGNVLKRFGFRS